MGWGVGHSLGWDGCKAGFLFLRRVSCLHRRSERIGWACRLLRAGSPGGLFQGPAAEGCCPAPPSHEGELAASSTYSSSWGYCSRQGCPSFTSSASLQT